MRFTRLLPFALALTLAACFDQDMTISFPDADHVEVVEVLTASTEYYSLSTENSDDMCEGGESEWRDDGSYVCIQTKSGTLDDFMQHSDATEGMAVERRDGGLIYVAFDVASITSRRTPSEDPEIPDQMKAKLAEALAGHASTINVKGSEIVETNGAISDDGKQATYVVPLSRMLEDNPEPLEDFFVLLKPGS